MPDKELHTALERLKAGQFRPGEGMEAAHAICQRHEGEPLFDWLHALVHRIEGDEGNAAYWYRRSGRGDQSRSIEEEWHAIHQARPTD